jgi:hypothetical protein
MRYASTVFPIWESVKLHIIIIIIIMNLLLFWVLDCVLKPKHYLTSVTFQGTYSEVRGK